MELQKEGRRLIDMPIECSGDEALGVGMYADILSTFIMNCETPITIGIQGDWGIGKTSLLNLVKEKLQHQGRRQDRYHVIYFNTWQYSQFNQEEYLGLSILKGIMNSIQNLEAVKSQDNENFKRTVSKFKKLVGNLTNQVVKSRTGIDLKDAIDKTNSGEADILEKDITAYLSQIKAEFADLVHSIVTANGASDKLVILIDDLDRIKPVRALEFLEAIKNFLDVEDCVFVIAVDYAVIQSGMIEKLGKSAQELQGKSYFDKIIQVPFNMPVTSYQTDRYIMSLLGWDSADSNREYKKTEHRDEFFLKIKDNQITKDAVDYFYNITRLTVGNNPRGIKRAVNYANLLKMIVRKKRKEDYDNKGEKWKLDDAKFLYALACMQLAWPELFRHFAEMPSPETVHLYQDFDYLDEIPGIDSLFKRVHNPEEVKSQITGFFDEFISVIDNNGDGEINTEEFKPIWKMMQQANLTCASLSNLDEDLKEFRKNAIANVDPGKEPLIDSLLNLISHSKWKNPSCFKLLEAGKKFKNITWNKEQIGSLVTTKKEAVSLYLKIDTDVLKSCLPADFSAYIHDVKDVGHYGTGNTKIDLHAISNTPNKFEMMNTLLDNFLGAFEKEKAMQKKSMQVPIFETPNQNSAICAGG